jgi:hypothetical protein
MTMTFNDPRLGASLDNPSLEDRIMNLSRELAVANGALEQENERIDAWRKMHSRLAEQIDNVVPIIKDAIINDDVDIDTLKSIANELCIELTREVRIKIKIEASGTATVPIDFDLDDIDDEISVDFSNNYGTDTELNIEVDDMTVDWQDI